MNSNNEWRLPQSPEELEALEIDKYCAFKTVLSGGGGFALGGVFGLFMSSLDFAGPSMNPDLHNQSSKIQLKIMAKDMAQRSWSSAKNFALVGAIYSTTECIVESYRAKTDLYNSVYSGCITGGILSARAGPSAVIPGCVGFAAFSAAIDYWIRHSS